VGSERQPTSPGLTRERVTGAALELLDSDGLDGLSMRGVADRLGVKAASLYWHVRDRRELLDLVAASVLAGVPLPADGPWRGRVIALVAGLRALLDEHPNLAPLLVEARGAVAGSPPGAGLVELLDGAGLTADEAASAAGALLAAVLLVRSIPTVTGAGATNPPTLRATVLVDLGSIGVTLRAGVAGGAPATVMAAEGAATVAASGHAVVVRRPLGQGRSEVLLDPGRAWSIRVGGGTANTRLLLAGLAVDGIKIDSGAARVEAVLPRPNGAVPIEISSGVTGVRLHRPRGTAAVARVSGGVLRLRLDATSTRASVGDSTWASGDPDAVAADRYELRVNSGTVDVLLDQRAPVGPPAPSADGDRTGHADRADPGPAIEMLLDGIEARLSGRPRRTG